MQQDIPTKAELLEKETTCQTPKNKSEPSKQSSADSSSSDEDDDNDMIGPPLPPSMLNKPTSGTAVGHSTQAPSAVKGDSDADDEEEDQDEDDDVYILLKYFLHLLPEIVTAWPTKIR